MILHTNAPPQKFPIIPDAIPEEMRALPNWVVWKYITRDGKPTKVPFDPKRPGRNAKANDPDTWGTFAQAHSLYTRGGFEGVGFQFTGSGMTGVDFDHKPYPGDIHPLAEQALVRLDTYSETTPSRKGEHAILWGKLPEWASNRKQIAEDLEVEVYSEGRFFTVTGEVIQSPFIESRQEALEALLIEWGMVKPVPLTREGSTGQTAAFTGTDAELWERIFASSSGEQVRALTDGDLSRYEGDHSRADFAMCGHLAFWCNGNPERMDAMFRQTALMRPKWDAKHRSDGSTYGQMTIGEALNRWDGQGYDPTRRTHERREEQGDWSDPQVLLKGRQHLASSGSHGRTVDSYSALWQALVGVVVEGYTIRDGDTLTVTSYGMTELYARAGGRLVDRRQQLKFLHAQGMCGPLIRQDSDNPRSAWLLTMPANPAMLPMWLARGSLQPLPVNDGLVSRRRKGGLRDTYISVIKDYGSQSTNRNFGAGNIPFWTLFVLAVLGEGTTADICDLSGKTNRVVRRHLGSLPTLVDQIGGRRWQRWRSVLTPQQVGELHLHLSAPEVERRKRRMFEARLDFHEDKFRYLTSRGLHERAALHFRYAEKYRKRLEEAA